MLNGTRPHGRTKYVMEKCRCDVCRDDAARYERERRQRVVPTLVDAGLAREHIERLMAMGMGYKRIAEVSGVAETSVQSIIYGRPSVGRPPSRRIRPDTEQRLLAVTFDPSDGALVDGDETRRKIDELVAAGVPRARIAERIGCKRPTLQIRDGKVEGRTARVVAEMHKEMVDGTLVTFRNSRFGRRVLTFERTDVDPRTVDWTDVDRLFDDVADALEARIDGAEWRQWAACRGRAPWVFFPARGDHRAVTAALRICGACTVRQECLEANIDQREGIWGGKTQRQLRELRRTMTVARTCIECRTTFQWRPADQHVICSDECRHARRLRMQDQSRIRVS